MATQLSAEQLEQSLRAPAEMKVPAPTAWPLILAFGFTLMFAGLLTSASVSALGVVLFLGLLGRVEPEHSARVNVLSLYWHFVDAVWVVVFIVVYVLGR